MLYWLSQYDHGPLRIFKYLTFRSGGAFLTAFLLVILFGPMTVRLLKELRAVAGDRYKGMANAQELIDAAKAKTPSMGGILIVLATLAATLVWAPLNQPLVWIALAVMVIMALLGFWDDYAKVAYPGRDGISGRLRLTVEALTGSLACLALCAIPGVADNMTELHVPFIKDPALKAMSLWMIVFFGALVITAAANAVNLTDGLDGLATGCTVICTAVFLLIAYLSGNSKFSAYLGIPFVPGCGEIGVFAAAMIGACVGFLWYNCHPASMFMGDTGSLALGGSIGLIAVIVRQELLLVIVGGIFVWEAASVLIQTSYFKFTKRRFGEGRRVFLMAPIHHHYQKKGWRETQVVMRFWIIALILAGIGLATLKIR